MKTTTKTAEAAIVDALGFRAPHRQIEQLIKHLRKFAVGLEQAQAAFALLQGRNPFEPIRDELKRVSKGQPETWGYAYLFNEMVDTAEKDWKQHARELAAELKRPKPSDKDREP